ncbi:MAG TPA: hypothetical protein VG479_06380 [Gaiellaceae bacterium]|jgi:hypothetical protein|nr:hypothetical protein [Gaiellaceae bacterium]
MGDARLALLHELERADEEVAATLTELDELYAETEAVRERALELEAFFVRLPARRAATAGERDRARHVEAEARAAVETAAAALREAEASGNADALAAARRLDVRARDSLTAAERRASGAEEAIGRLEADASAAQRERESLDRRARGLAGALRERPRLAADAGDDPAPGLAGVSEWGTHARAALLVARSQLADDRDAVIRQANELGALVLGEPLTATSAHDVARRVEHELEP